MDIFPPNIKAPYTSAQQTPIITGVDSTIVFEHLSSLFPNINNNVKRFFGNNKNNAAFTNNGRIPVHRHSSAEHILALSSSASDVPIIEVTPPSPAGRSEKRTFEAEINKMFINTLKTCKRNIRRFSAPYCSVNHLDLSNLGKNTGTFDKSGRPRTNSMPCISKENLLQVPKKNGGRSGSGRKKNKRRSSLPASSASGVPDFAFLQSQQKIKSIGISSLSLEKINYLPPDVEGGSPKTVHEIYISGSKDNPDYNESGIIGFKNDEKLSKKSLEECGKMDLLSSNEQESIPECSKDLKVEKMEDEKDLSGPKKVSIYDDDCLKTYQTGIKSRNEQTMVCKIVKNVPLSVSKKDDNDVIYHDDDHETFNKIKKEHKRTFIKDRNDDKTDKMMKSNTNNKKKELMFKQDSSTLLAKYHSCNVTRCELNGRVNVTDSLSHFLSQPVTDVTRCQLNKRDISDSSLAEKLIIINSSSLESKKENHNEFYSLSYKKEESFLLSDHVVDPSVIVQDDCYDKSDDNTNNKFVEKVEDAPLSQLRSHSQTHEEKNRKHCKVIEKGGIRDEISKENFSEKQHYNQQGQKLLSQEKHSKVTNIGDHQKETSAIKENVITTKAEENVICNPIPNSTTDIDFADEIGIDVSGCSSICYHCCNIDNQNKSINNNNNGAVEELVVKSTTSELCCFHNDIVQDKHQLYNKSQQQQHVDNYSEKKVFNDGDQIILKKEKDCFGSFLDLKKSDIVASCGVCHSNCSIQNTVLAVRISEAEAEGTLSRCCVYRSETTDSNCLEVDSDSKKQSIFGQSVENTDKSAKSTTKSDYVANTGSDTQQKSASSTKSTNVAKETTVVRKPVLPDHHSKKSEIIACQHQILNNNNQTLSICSSCHYSELKEEITDKCIIAPLKSTLNSNSRVDTTTENQTDATRQLKNNFEGLSLTSTKSYKNTKVSFSDLDLTKQSFSNNNNKNDKSNLLLSLNDNESSQRKEKSSLVIITDTSDLKTFKGTDQNHTSQEITGTTDREATPINSILTNASLVPITATTLHPQQEFEGKKVANCNRQQFPEDHQLNNKKVNYHADTIKVINNTLEQVSIVQTIKLKPTATTITKEVKSTNIMALDNEIDEGNNNSFHNDSCNNSVKRNTSTLEKRNSDTSLLKSENEDSILIEKSEQEEEANFVNETATELSDNTKLQDCEENDINIDSTEDIKDMSPTRHQLTAVISDVLSGKNPGIGGSDLTSNLFFLPNANKDTNKVVYNAKSEDCNFVVTTDPKKQQTDNVVDGTDSLSLTSASSTDSSDTENDSTLNVPGNKTALTKASSLTGLETFSKTGVHHRHLANETRTVSLHEDSIHDKELLDALSNIDPSTAPTKPEITNNKPTSKSLEELDVGIKSLHKHQHRPAAPTTALATRVSALNRINKEFANAMLRKAVSLVEIQNERLKENVAKWEQRFMSTEILSAPDEDWFPRVSMEDCSTCDSCRSRSSSYHNLLYDFDTANQFPIYQPTVIDYEEDVEAIYNGIVQSSENLSTHGKSAVADEHSSNTETAPASLAVDNNTTLSSSCDVSPTTSSDEVTDMDKTIVDTTSSTNDINNETLDDTLQAEPTKSTATTNDSVAATVVATTEEGEDNKITKQMLKLKKDKFMKQSQLAFGSLKDRFRKVKSKV